jgi:hypothetical protein
VKIGYGKLGRSMPLDIKNCGTLGGDVEMIPPIKALAERHPDDTFYLLGRNTGENPKNVGLPRNVINPWSAWGWSTELRQRLNAAKLNHGSLSIEEQIQARRIFDEVTGATFQIMDAQVFWLGQHGTTNSPIPKVKERGILTKPHDWSAYYASFILRGINRWRSNFDGRLEEVWLNADPRNYLKARDLQWPLRHPVLAQYTDVHRTKHHRWGLLASPEAFQMDDVAKALNPETWQSKCYMTYSRIEVNGLAPGTPFGDLVTYSDDWARPHRFGLFINEARKEVHVTRSRLTAYRKWIAPLDPDWVHGKWSEESQSEIGRNIIPAPWERYYPLLNATRCTFTTPSSGSGWATCKPWEMFAGGTVCFFHPLYDTQDNILVDAPEQLRQFLRVDSVEELQAKVNHLNTEAGRLDWEWLVNAQREHFLRAMAEQRYLKMIEARIYGGSE